jgi:hypothetical protein
VKSRIVYAGRVMRTETVPVTDGSVIQAVMSDAFNDRRMVYGRKGSYRCAMTEPRLNFGQRHRFPGIEELTRNGRTGLAAADLSMGILTRNARLLAKKGIGL